jgi:predicted GH43/DUF377 family glycosyl hydrolase
MVPFKVNSIFNPGAVKYGDKYLLLCRVEMPNGRSSLVLAESKNGFDFKVNEKPILTPEDHKDFYEYVNWGIEDPRITKIDDKYFIAYTGYSEHMPVVMLSETKDFKSFKILGLISEPSNKDAALFPEKINGAYWKLDRPTAELKKEIWISSSPDLIHWGNYKCLAKPLLGTWEADKIGNSSNPVKTKDGWLMLYHGVRGFGISSTYRIGVMLMDLEKPWILKGRSIEPILTPEYDYERVGDVMNVVFSNGWIVEEDSSVKIYYSGADTNICIAETTIDQLLAECIRK